MTWQRDPVVRDLLDSCSFPAPGSSVHCAVSGGADSLALLALAVAAELHVTAHHVDHGLRPGSDDESGFVRERCHEVGATFVSHSVRIEPGANVEARAREARYSVLPDDVMTGHTADDRAETVIINLLRGAGTNGLSGMRAQGGPSGEVRHPLLGLRRSDTEKMCSLLSWIPLVDPTNRDPAILRNRIRHEVLPLLNDVAGRDLVPILTRQAELVADDADLLDLLAADLDPTDARAIASAPVALARRAIRRWLSDDHPPDSAAVERVLAVARGESTACELPGGGRVSRRNQRLSRSDPPRHD